MDSTSDRTIPLSASARRYAREIRSPNPARWHGAADPRSWLALRAVRDRLHPSAGDLRRARDVVRRGRHGGRFLATLPRSGTNWLVAMLESSINAAAGLDPDYELVDEYWVSGDPGWAPRGRRHCWPNSLLSVVHSAMTTAGPITEPVILGAHFPYSRGTTDLGASGRPVVLIRDPNAAIESLIQKVERDRKFQRDGSVDHAHALALARGYVGFYDYWSGQARRRPSDVLVVRFEDLNLDPLQEVLRVLGHWDLDVGLSAAETAVELCARDRMAKKASSDPTNVRVTIDAPTTDADLLEELRSILRGASTEAFGYNFET